MENDQSDIDRITLAALGLGSEDNQKRSREELISHNPALARYARSTARQFARFRVAKRAVDIFGTLLMAIVWVPICLVAAGLMRLSSPGPMFYKRSIQGKGGTSFGMYGLRTRYINSDEVILKYVENHPEHKFKFPVDPRVTPIGRQLRRLGIDHWPAFYNVLRGEMSLVGPTVELCFCSDPLSSAHRIHIARTRERPGVFDLVHCVLDMESDTLHTCLDCDLYYITHESIFLDFRIVLARLLIATKLPRKWALHIFGLPSVLSLKSMSRHGDFQQDDGIIELRSDYAKAYREERDNS